jgi:hypothetical protein
MWQRDDEQRRKAKQFFDYLAVNDPQPAEEPRPIMSARLRLLVILAASIGFASIGWAAFKLFE